MPKILLYGSDCINYNHLIVDSETLSNSTNNAEKMAHSLVDMDVVDKMREAKVTIGIGGRIELLFEPDRPTSTGDECS